MSTILDKTRALRSEAWAEVKASPAFAAFKVMDDAVVALGGGSAMPSLTGVANNSARQDTVGAAVQRASSKRISHGDAAALALRETGVPLTIGPFMEKAIAKGAVLKGDTALSNFRSAISKDARFVSVPRDGAYFWWFKDEPLPPSKNETASPDLLTGPAVSSSHSSEGGGDADAATNLAR